MSHPHRFLQRALGIALALSAVILLGRPAPSFAGFDVVRFDGIIGETAVPGSVGDLTLAIGARSIPYSVLAAQKMTGNPAMAPEIFSALGPGPPPLRVEGRDGTIAKITEAKAGTRLTITGNLNVGSSFLTLMDVAAVPTPSPAQ